MQNILFYKYVQISDLEEFKVTHLNFSNSINLKGKVIIAEEGINGCLTGDDKDIAKYIEYMRNDPRFIDIDFKTSSINEHGFKRMLVKIKKEIITTRLDDDLLNYSAPYVEPTEFKKWLDENKDIVILDARNDYESEVGAFENAIKPDIDIFNIFPKALTELENIKEKTIVTYCTGGIRCEKFSGYMRKNGFKNVYQLHGGIIKYGIEVGDAHWNGKCLVYDRRGAVEIAPEKQDLTSPRCCVCFLPTDIPVQKCARDKCKIEYIICDNCKEILEGSCSKSCRNHNRLHLAPV